jgi:hypothetical protein
MVLGGFALATFAWADSWLAPSPAVYKSANGQHVFRTVPNKEKFFGAATGALKSKRDKDGPEELLWEGKLVNTPYKAFVSDDGKHVVTIDTYANLGFKHSLVVYDAKGKVIADYELEKLLTNDEIAKNVKRTEGSRWWSADAKFSFDAKEQHFVVSMKWGKEVRVSLMSGKIVVP